MSFATIENNKDNGFEGKITILRPNGDVQKAVGNTEVVGFKRGLGKKHRLALHHQRLWMPQCRQGVKDEKRAVDDLRLNTRTSPGIQKGT